MTLSVMTWRKRLRPRTLGIVAAGFLLLALLSVAASRIALSDAQSANGGAIHHHGPWIFGRPDAPFTIIEYADLECPYCRAYSPVLRRWIKEHPQVNWEWWNLPLSIHDSAAVREAVLAECVGEVEGNRAFWRTVARIYRHTRSDGAGIAADTQMPGASRAIAACLETGKAAKVIRAQVAKASRQHILGTPTLRILDRRTGQSFEVKGPVTGDSLFSAIDWLAAQNPYQMPSPAPR